MADPQAKQLLDACEAVLATVLVANGFYTDAGQVVTTEPAQLSDDTAPALALCVYLEGIERPADPAQRDHGWLVNLVVIGKRAHGANLAQQRQIELLADIERAMTDRSAYPQGIQAPRFQEAKFINRVEGLPWVGVAIRYSAHIARPRA
jgi:hypothetical protein